MSYIQVQPKKCKGIQIIEDSSDLMNNLPLVSIRIPAYNHESYISETLNSALLDPYPNKEIVVIDDASTDGTWNVICEWVSKNKNLINVRHYRNTSNLGVSKTVNKLHKLCEGEYIVGIASDDLLIPGGIDKRVNHLKARPNKQVVFGDCEVINANGELVFTSGLSDLYNINKNNLFSDETQIKELISNWGVPGGTLMMTRSVALDIEFNEDLIIEDFDLFLKWMSRGYLSFINEKISQYRIHETNTSRTKSKQHRINNLKSFNLTIQTHVHNKKLKGLEPLGYKTEAKISYLESKYIRCGVFLIKYVYSRIFLD